MPAKGTHFLKYVPCAGEQRAERNLPASRLRIHMENTGEC